MDQAAQGMTIVCHVHMGNMGGEKVATFKVALQMMAIVNLRVARLSVPKMEKALTALLSVAMEITIVIVVTKDVKHALQGRWAGNFQ